ncbi:c-Myc-binding protein [Halyomorpha halys]|uniref:c-Myc-binding protein n=1 Tax=Halyomorpha halys TaxID=286706 RepID=UPI0006D4D7A2|nr:c-Myc-binding protein [Halyomorpha halys]
MSTYRPIDSKREEFRKYLERAGVMDALTKVLVMLYEEPDKPEDALEFVRTNLGDKRPTLAEVEALKNELDSAVQKIKDLEEELMMLRGESNEDRKEGEKSDETGTKLEH